MPVPTLTADRTPAHDLPYLFPGQSQKEAFVNEAFARLDALVQPVVLDERAAPPDDPSPGHCYLVADGAAGVWAGRDRAIGLWAGNQWLYLRPRDGGVVYDLASASTVRFDAAAGWHRTSAPAVPTGGAVQDAEARAAIAAILAGLRATGHFSA